jgi:hypothetical protein
MSPAFKKILKELPGLSSEERQHLRKELERESLAPRVPPDPEVIRAIKGKYADVLSPSEEFIARKAQEIDLEDRRRRS